jgi:hypothetical protein
MAFKMNPGRGNYSKTGHGIPSPFKQVDKEVDAMIAAKKARTAAEAKSKADKDSADAAKKEASRKRIAQVDATEYKAKSDSTATDNKMRKEGFSYLAGKMGNAKANETRKAGSPYKDAYSSVDENPSTGKFKKSIKFSPTKQAKKSPMKQVDKEVDAMIAKKKERDAKAKTEKARSEGEAARSKVERGIRIKLNEETRSKASADSTAVDKKMRDAGMPYNAGVMGNKKANETRKAGSPYKDSYESVDQDKTTGKYKKKINFKSDSPAKQLGRQAVTKVAGKKSPAKMKSC